jgi:SAM-dependent methyltransferase
MSWAIVWWVLTGIFLISTLRLRAHAAHLRHVPAEGAPAVAGRWVWVTAEGVEVPASVRESVEAWAEESGLEAVDVVPRDLPAEQALQLAGSEDPGRYRDRWLAPSLGAQQALAVTSEVWHRMSLDLPTSGLDPVAMNRLARETKRHAPATTDLAVAGGWRALRDDPAKRRSLLRARAGPVAGALLWFPVLRLAVLVTGVVLFPLAGGVAAGVWCLQPLLALAGTPLRPRDLLPATLLRWLLVPVALVRGLLGRWRPAEGDAGGDLEVLRPVYDELLAGGTARLFEERRPDCPMCVSADLRVLVRAVDLVQRKPGRFVLERCGGCGHVFQNPRLSIEGLDFYYRDFYDGMGEEQAELLFSSMDSAYRARAAMLAGATPKSWIDVGTGHAHFCLAARREWPDTSFDGLDMSASIEVAEQRGWVANGYRGFLVDLAPSLAGRYDVVSMHHYLEHTREPLEELDAAVSLLARGGHLLVELPDPECRWGRILRRYWIPWFQPQHQHLMTQRRLESELVERGLEVVRRDQCRSELPINLTAALLLVAMHVAPPPGLPWRRRSGIGARLRFSLAVLAVVPLLPLAFLADRLVGLVVGRRWRSNAYRVLGRLPSA